MSRFLEPPLQAREQASSAFAGGVVLTAQWLDFLCLRVISDAPVFSNIFGSDFSSENTSNSNGQ